jgi:hypothetical protein
MLHRAQWLREREPRDGRWNHSKGTGPQPKLVAAAVEGVGKVEPKSPVPPDTSVVVMAPVIKRRA